MPDAPPPLLAEGTLRPAPQVLTREQIDAVLGDFRTWLEQLADSAAASDSTPGQRNTVDPATAPDLHTLLAQFIALRHEINLQTRSARSQQEQTGEALQQLQTALESLRRAEESAAERRAAAEEETLRPLLKTLVDAHDALALAQRPIRRVRDAVLPELEQLRDLPPRLVESEQSVPTPLAPPAPTFWGRLFGRKPTSVAGTPPAAFPQQHRDLAEQLKQAAAQIQQMLHGLLTGYTMSVQRLERALQQHGLEPIATVGEAFDPESMEVVEVVVEPGRTRAEVIEEARRGYRWRGRVFRFAQVRVARPAT